MAWLDVSGAKIHYEIWGEGDVPWVTLVNGYSRPLSDFRSLGRFLTGQGLRVLALDNRGAGETEFRGLFRMDEMVGDIVAIWDAVGCEKSHLLGISLGGMLAMTVAARFPARVEKLVLVSTGARASLIASPTSPNPEVDLLRYFAPVFLERNKLFVSALVKETAKVFQDPTSLARARAQREAVRGFDATVELAKIEAPTLVIHGDADAVIPFSAGEELVRRIAGAAMHRFSGAGHLLLAEVPKLLYQVVAEFFLT